MDLYQREAGHRVAGDSVTAVQMMQCSQCTEKLDADMARIRSCIDKYMIYEGGDLRILFL